MSFNNKTVIITGGTRGIGKAIALKLAAEGANIVIAAKSVEENPKLGGTIFSAAAEMEAAGGKALAVQCDIRFEDQIQNVIDKTIEKFGGIDILVNNASAISLTATEQTEPKRFDLMHDINVRGTFFVTKACIPHLKKSANPHILTLSPPINLDPKWFDKHVAYTLTKYNMSMMTIGWAKELAKDRIAANSLWPRTTIDTAAVRNLLGGAVLANMTALTTAQAAALTTDQIVAFTTEQIAGLQTADINAMDMAQAAAFETADIAVMTSAQVDALILASPIVLDLDGNGVQTRAAANGVYFDLGGTGNTSQKVGWTGDGDALLVRDRNGDGLINDGRELYGVATQNAQGQRMGNGYAALSGEDSNQDGKVNAEDANFGELKLWVDANADGKTDAGELRGLVEMGVVELNLDYAVTAKIDKGNYIGMVSDFTKADGSRNEMADVWFGKEKTTLPPVAELLAAPQPDLLASPAAAAGKSAETQAATLVPMAHRSLLDDETRQNLLL